MRSGSSLPVKGGDEEAPRGKERSGKADARPAGVLPAKSREKRPEAAPGEKWTRWFHGQTGLP